MRALPESLNAALASGVTTLCWCWRIERLDGQIFGFTDHDRDLVVEGLTYRAGAAQDVGALSTRDGFAPGAAALGGVLDSAAITETDLSGGRYDGASVEVRRVDWLDPSSHARVWRGRFGEVRRGELSFEVELRGLAAQLDATIGRVLQRRCDAELGDARCSANLAAPTFAGAGAVLTGLATRRFTASGLAAFAASWFAEGRLAWTSGANAGAEARVEAHQVADGLVTLTLSAPPAAPIASGDAFTITAGCDKRWRTCHDKFANVLNFRGFPMIPGDDWLLAGPADGELHDGASLWTNRDL